jgi:hypothetical protein
MREWAPSVGHICGSPVMGKVAANSGYLGSTGAMAVGSFKLAILFGLTVTIAGSAPAGEDCTVETKMFERDVRNERISWQLVGANYKRRVARYCEVEERRRAFARLNLTDEELKLMGVSRQ